MQTISFLKESHLITGVHQTYLKFYLGGIKNENGDQKSCTNQGFQNVL